LKWFGHLMQMKEDWWPKTIHSWTRPGNRRRGRPRKQWEYWILNGRISGELKPDDTGASGACSIEVANSYIKHRLLPTHDIWSLYMLPCISCHSTNIRDCPIGDWWI
jgi:hypothetical protein